MILFIKILNNILNPYREKVKKQLTKYIYVKNNRNNYLKLSKIFENILKVVKLITNYSKNKSILFVSDNKFVNKKIISIKKILNLKLVKRKVQSGIFTNLCCFLNKTNKNNILKKIFLLKKDFILYDKFLRTLKTDNILEIPDLLFDARLNGSNSIFKECEKKGIKIISFTTFNKYNNRYMNVPLFIKSKSYMNVVTILSIIKKLLINGKIKSNKKN
ncbi:30S ribosomal protein S2 [Candidatus Vidania fulgoroideorum]